MGGGVSQSGLGGLSSVVVELNGVIDAGKTRTGDQKRDMTLIYQIL